MFGGDGMGMQGMEGGQGHAGSQNQSQSGQMNLAEQLRLMKLQQLHQLSQQIFQQQLELINGQGSLNSAATSLELSNNPQAYHGLPTPISSTELRPQSNQDFVSPMVLFQHPEYNIQREQHHPQASTSHHAPESSPVFPPHQHHHQQPPYNTSSARSAPADLAFTIMSPQVPLSSPGDMEGFDMSPLASPWFPAQAGPPQSYAAAPSKRAASTSGDETSGKPTRKRQSPLDTRPTAPLPSRRMSTSRGTKSANSTPLLTGSRRRGGSMVTDIPGDTPSPVDLSMPPPAPPPPGPSTSANAPPPNLMPATPGSIMKIGNMGLGSGLAPPSAGQSKAEGTSKQKASAKAKACGKSKDAKIDAAVRVSPILKPILPAGGSSSLTMTPATPSSQPLLQGRKTSHKAAEQARRDQIKAAYNDLRMLLPPIPSEAVSQEHVLPGSMPPRGPPKGEGPNKAVSKLQLLLCGNDYIRKLKGRVERRDEEIARLREEVRRLRVVVGDADEGGEELDLERDLDAAEPSALRMSSVGDGDEADEEEY